MKKRETKPDFGLVGVDFHYQHKPTEYVKLVINAEALWFCDTLKMPNGEVLEQWIIRAIEKTFKARSAK